MIRPQKNTREIDVFMYVTCLEQQSFCHALRKNLKFKLLYFQNKECYPAENKQSGGNLYFLSCDEDKTPKLCLVMNFGFLWRHVKTKDTCSCKMGAYIGHRFLSKSLAFVNVGVQKVCFSFRFFSREFNSGNCSIFSLVVCQREKMSSI